MATSHDFLNDLERDFGKSIDSISQLLQHASSPNTFLTGLGVAGFMLGSLLRRDARHRFPVDPLLVLAAGAVAGFLIAPRDRKS
jgi:hypothetical protein